MTLTGGKRVATRVASLPSRAGALPVAVALSVTVVWTTLGVVLHDIFRTGMDLAIFDQAARSVSHFQAPVSSMKAPGFPLWGDHFHPLIVLAAPLYWIWPDPRMLIFLQAACAGLTAAILAKTALELRPRGHALALIASLGLAFSVGMREALRYDFHEIALTAPLLALALRALIHRRWRPATWWALAMMLTKEDASFLTAGVGAAMMLMGRRLRGALLGLGAAAWFLVVTKAVIPALNPTGGWDYTDVFSPDGFGPSLVRSLVWPGSLTMVVLTLIVGAGAWCLRSPLAIVPIFALASRALTGYTLYLVIGYHYNMLPGVAFFFATLDALARERFRELAVRAVACLHIAGTILFVPKLADILEPQDPTLLADARAAIAYVDDGRPIAADVHLTPHLTPRHEIVTHIWAPHFTDSVGNSVFDVADWAVIDTQTTSHQGPGWTRPLIERLTAEGWRPARQFGRYVVLERSIPEDALRGDQPGPGLPDGPG